MARATKVRQLMLAGGLLVLAGCQAAVGPGALSIGEATQGLAETTPGETAPEATAEIAAAQAPLFDSQPPPPPPPPINDDPQQVMGLPTGALNALLGEPRFVRRDLAAEVWQYRAEGCVLDVFLYDREAFGVAEVVHYELRPSRGIASVEAKALPARAQRSCFAKLLEQNDTAAG